MVLETLLNGREELHVKQGRGLILELLQAPPSNVARSQGMKGSVPFAFCKLQGCDSRCSAPGFSLLKPPCHLAY